MVLFEKISIITMLFGAFLLPSIGHAQRHGKVAVISLSDSGVGEQTAAQISQALLKEVKSLVGTRLKNRRPTQVCELEDLVNCASNQGKKIKADLVLAGTVAALADAQLIDLRLIDVASKTELSRLQSPLSGDLKQDRKTLRELAVRLLTPENYKGQLLLSSLPAGDKLLVDGAEISAEAGVPIALAVGPHVVELVHDGQTLSSKVVQIAYGQSSVVDLLAEKTGTKDAGDTTTKNADSSTQTHEITAISGDAQTGTSTPDASGNAGAKESAAVNWPMWASVGVAAVGLATTIGLTTYFFTVVQPGLDTYDVNGMRDQVIAKPGEAVFALDFYKQLAFQTQLGIAAALVVTLASGGAATYFALNSEDAENASVAK